MFIDAEGRQRYADVAELETLIKFLGQFVQVGVIAGGQAQQRYGIVSGVKVTLPGQVDNFFDATAANRSSGMAGVAKGTPLGTAPHYFEGDAIVRSFGKRNNRGGGEYGLVEIVNHGALHAGRYIGLGRFAGGEGAVGIIIAVVKLGDINEGELSGKV